MGSAAAAVASLEVAVAENRVLDAALDQQVRRIEEDVMTVVAATRASAGTDRNEGSDASP
jgi:hypothetical protein